MCLEGQDQTNKPFFQEYYMSPLKRMVERTSSDSVKILPFDETLRPTILRFMSQVDADFHPPLSSDKRRGSLEKYIDYMLADGRGKVQVALRDGEAQGFMGYRIEEDGRLYMSTWAMKKDIRGSPTFLKLLDRVFSDPDLSDVELFWATTSSENIRVQKTLAKLGMVQTAYLSGDYDGERDTLVFQGNVKKAKDYIKKLMRRRYGWGEDLPSPRDFDDR
jgi:RimJ/RimL family protein N-acetyltransferase